MLTQRDRASGIGGGLLLVALGFAIGALVEPARWFERGPAPTPRHPELVPAASPARPPERGLETLELVIPESSAAVLERVRAAALERGIITQTDADTVPAEVVAGGVRMACTLRIKGDWTDHVDGARWSYRIRLDDGSFRGMREFSIQAPKTRGYLWEWLVHEACRREGLLVPRSTFLDVVQNGHALGVYFLEEHFEKELLESQGRREGPIVVWDESTLWSTMLEEGDVPARGVPPLASHARAGMRTPEAAAVRAYGEKRLSSLPALRNQLDSALEELKALRALALAEQPETDRRRVQQGLDELAGRTLENLVNVERLGALHAMASLFQLEHGLAWHNLRFYHDPVTQRLEPILFDAGAQDPSARDPVPFRAEGLTAAFARSLRYQEELFTHLGRLLEPAWLDGFFAAVEPDLARFEAALRATDDLPPGMSSGEMKQRLRAQALYLRRTLTPADPINFLASYRQNAADPGAGELEIEAWATTRSPVRLEGFRFSNGSSVSAASALTQASLGALARGGAVVLPPDGRTVVFRFAMDERLANLEQVEKVTRALRDQLTGEQALDLDIDARFALLVEGAERSERLAFRRKPDHDATAGRPAAPTLAEALERHPYLRHDAERGRLVVLPGVHDVQEDLVLPSGFPLEIGPATTLRFPARAMLLADAPLFFAGSPREPVVLEPLEGADSWDGIVVLSAPGRSEWTNVVVRRTHAVARGGWLMTGGITFYRSPLTLRAVRFEGTQAEDGLNVFGTDLLFEKVTFSGCASDSFDGDFVTGEVRDCTFEDGKADGLDVSGSDVRVVNCRFLRLGDKGCSIGERSRARIEGGIAEDVGLGVASKDDSDVELSGMTIRARHYALAAFVKKPEYGPARLVARALTILPGATGTAIAQTGCTIELDGTRVPTQDIDIEASYEEGVLGHAK